MATPGMYTALKHFCLCKVTAGNQTDLQPLQQAREYSGRAK
jgi:hypothetical protein